MGKQKLDANGKMMTTLKGIVNSITIEMNGAKESIHSTIKVPRKVLFFHLVHSFFIKKKD